MKRADIELRPESLLRTRTQFEDLHLANLVPQRLCLPAM